MSTASSPNSIRFRPLSSLKRLLMPTGPRPRKIPFGVYKSLVLNVDFAAQTQFYFGFYETETFACIRKNLGVAQWVIDIGAGQGELALIFAKQPVCRKVVAIEPNPREVEKFKANAAMNPVGSEKIELACKFAGPGDPATHLPLDAINVPLEAPGFVKLDVDGFEVQVLQSASRLIQQGKGNWLIETHALDLENQCIDVFKAAGYQVSIVDNAWWRRFLPEERVIEHNRWIYAQR